MTPEEIQAMAKGLAEGQALWYLLSAVIGGAIAGLGGYLAEKGKNRATKEDIATITREVEEVRNEFIRGVEDLKAHHQLRMVAAERRLQSHQEAFTHWVEITSALYWKKDSEVEKRARDCSEWFNKNCIYLAPESRASFSGIGPKALLQMHLVKKNESTVQLEQILNEMEEIGAILLREVELPRMSKSEIQKVVSLNKVPD